MNALIIINKFLRRIKIKINKKANFCASKRISKILMIIKTKIRSSKKLRLLKKITKFINL